MRTTPHLALPPGEPGRRRRRAVHLSAFGIASFVAATAMALLPPTPIAVSPVSARGHARVETRCPTFSWTTVAAAEGYDLVVSRLVPADASGDQMAIEETPTIGIHVPGNANSWTPTQEACLVLGERYAWAVRAIASGSPGEWSIPALLQVVPDPSTEIALRALAILQSERATSSSAPGAAAERRSTPARSASRSEPWRQPAPSGRRAATSQGTTFAVDASGNATATSFSGDGAGLSGVVVDLAETADALASDPADCAPGLVPLGVEAAGSAQLCIDVATQAELESYQPSSLAVNGANCSAGSVPTGAGASGAAEGCFDVATQAELAAYRPDSLAANPANCPNGNVPLGVNAAGAAQACLDLATFDELTTHSGSGDHDGRYANLTGDLLTGSISWACPVGSTRAGSWCIGNISFEGTYSDALTGCHSYSVAPGSTGASLCTYEAIVTCDQLDLGSTGLSSSCGDRTDGGTGDRIWIATIDGDTLDSTLDALTYKDDNTLQFTSGDSNRYYYCCWPINP